jgi:hypothetical protein
MHQGSYDAPHDAPHDDRMGGWALIMGSLLSLTTMALHPTGADMLRDYDTFAPRSILAHSLAIAALPLSVFGWLALGRRLRAAGARGEADLGLVTYVLAAVAVLTAGIASGLVAPMLAERILEAGAESDAMLRALFRYNGMVNQGFAAVFVAASAAAMTIWSAGALRAGGLPRALAGFGLLVGLVLFGITVAGRLRLDVHHFGMIIVAQSAWSVGVGVVLSRAAPPRTAPAGP